MRGMKNERSEWQVDRPASEEERSDRGEGIPAPPPVQPIPTQLAEKINGKQKSISRYETGASLPSIRTLVKIAEVLEKRAGYFLDE